MMSDLIIAVLVVAGATLTGRSLLALFDRVCGTREMLRPPAEIWGISILLGVSFTSAAAFVWSDMGQSLGSEFSWRQVICGGTLGVIAALRARRWSRTAGGAAAPSVFSRLALASQLVLSVVLVGVFVLPQWSPDAAGESRDHIKFKARVIYESGTIDAPALIAPPVVTADSREPLLLPLFERHVYALRGHVSDRLASIWSPFMFTGLLLSFAGVLSRRTSLEWGWLAATVLALLPGMLSSKFGVRSALAVLPTAGFHGVAVLCLWDAFQEAPGKARIRGILLASGMASSACFVMNQGIAFLFIDLLAWGVAVLLRNGRFGVEVPDDGPLYRWGRHFIGIGVFALFAAFLLTPWMRYRAMLPVSPDLAGWTWIETGQSLDRLMNSLRSLPHLMFRFPWTCGVPLCLTLFGILRLSRRNCAGPEQFLLLQLIGTMTVVLFEIANAHSMQNEFHIAACHQLAIILGPLAVLSVFGGGRLKTEPAVTVHSSDPGSSLSDALDQPHAS